MTRHNIIRMAQEAHRELVTLDYPGHTGQLDPWTMRLLERFANLIVVAEREACARLAECRCLDDNNKNRRIGHYYACKFIAADIRARGQE